MKQREIFIEALQKESTQARIAYLNDACGNDSELRQSVEELLTDHQNDDSFFLDIAPPGLSATIDQVRTDCPGLQIGPYKLLEQIGEGGMGTVYVAEQKEPVRRKVALKLIKPGMDSHQVVARFEAERQALALMNHPNIARVLDAGTTETGRPYFAMELVKGTPITEFCDQQKLDTRERLQLFITVCQAVQHAHQKGLIHRDLKPSNVLVEIHDVKPVPKVIDFGVAKAIGQQLTEKTLHTGFSQMIGTPLYMSPEQAGLSSIDIDTRSDIYSLGVLLYEILTGQTPFESETLREAGFDEMRRLISEVDPPRPSARISTLEAQALSTVSNSRKIDPHKLSRQLRGELDWIVMKALEKDRNRRYESANGLAADVQRFLNNEAVLACPPSVAYRFHKFARRNSGLILTGAVVCTALVLGTVISVWQAIQATRAQHDAEVAQTEEAAQRLVADRRRIEADEQRKEAESQRQQAEDARKEATANLTKAREAVDQMLTRVADERLSGVPQMEPVRKALLEDALKFYQGFLEQKNADPALRMGTGRALQRVGTIYHYFHQHDEAVKALRESVKLLEVLVADFPAEPDYRAALAEGCLSLADELTFGFARPQEAEPILRQALVLFETLADDFPATPQFRTRPGRVRQSLAVALAGLGRARDAEDESRSGVALAEKLVDQFPTEPEYRDLLAETLSSLAGALVRNDPQEAEKLLRQVWGIRVRVLAENPNSQHHRFATACNQESLANLLRDGGRLPEAEEAYRQAIALCQPIVADFPNGLSSRSALGNFYDELGTVLEATNRLDEAEQAYRLAWTVASDIVRPEAQPQFFWFERLDRTQAHLVKLLTAAGRTPAVECHYRQALTLWGKLAAQSPTALDYKRKLKQTYLLLANFLKAENRTEEAEHAATAAITLLEATLADLKTKLGSDHPDTLKSIHQLAGFCSAAERPTEAEHFYEEALSLFPNSARAHNALAWFLVTCPDVRHQNAARGVELAKKATELSKEVAGYWNTLGVAQYRASQWKDAIPSLKQAIHIDSLGTNSPNNSFNTFFLAMAHWQLDEIDAARNWYDQAIGWMEKNAPDDEELRRIRAEATELFGVK